ncbi:hypothetical protein [Streptomyces sp. NPDC050564]|uniref:hypothetical protein n=1 Tax=Streptomyces sp. NPDC050564 TaxID=3365631 RepID=UPI00379FF04E
MIDSLDETCEELVRVRRPGHADHLGPAEALAYASALETANASGRRQLKDRVHAASRATDRAGVALADPVSDPVGRLRSTVGNPAKALTGALGTVTDLLSPVRRGRRTARRRDVGGSGPAHHMTGPARGGR